MKLTRKTLFTASLTLLALIALPAIAGAQTGTMFVKNDNVCIGTDTCVEKFTVQGTGTGKTLALVQNTSATLVGARYINSLSNWEFRTDGLGDFIFNEQASPGQEVKIRKNGSVIMGPGGFAAFSLNPTGNLTIAGSLTQGSSRTIKENFASLDGREVLAKVNELEVLGWTYKNQDSLHIGPMAEDFYAAFGTGQDEKTLAPGDVAGVALAALQGMTAEIQEKDRQIDQLRAEMAELRALVEGLNR